MAAGDIKGLIYMGRVPASRYIVAFIRYPAHKIADGAISTSYTRPTWTPYFWSKHLEKIAKAMLNDTKCNRV